MFSSQCHLQLYQLAQTHLLSQVNITVAVVIDGAEVARDRYAPATFPQYFFVTLSARDTAPCSLSPRTPLLPAPSSPTPMRFSTHPPPSLLKTSACYSPPVPLSSCVRAQAPFKFKRRHVTCQKLILFTCLSTATTSAVFLNSARFFPSPTCLRAITRLSCRGDLLHLSPYAWRSIARHSLSCAPPPPPLRSQLMLMLPSSHF